MISQNKHQKIYSFELKVKIRKVTNLIEIAISQKRNIAKSHNCQPENITKIEIN